MRRAALLICLLMVAALPVPTAATITDDVTVIQSRGGYADGWTDGWVDGWKHVKGRVIPPIPPLPPLPPMYRYSYKDGYQDGFLAGRQAAGG